MLCWAFHLPSFMVSQKLNKVQLVIRFSRWQFQPVYRWSMSSSQVLFVSNLEVIRILAAYEKDYTITKYQTSLALKSILASLINSILIPMIVNYFIKAGGSSAVLYGEDGLASDVFMLGLTNSFLPPILKIIDISYIINRIKKWFASKPSNSNTILRQQTLIKPALAQWHLRIFRILSWNLICLLGQFISIHMFLCLLAARHRLLCFWGNGFDVLDSKIFIIQ